MVKLSIFGAKLHLQILQTFPILLGGLCVDALLDLLYQVGDVIFHFIEILIFRKESDLVWVVGLAETRSQQFGESSTHANLFWDIGDKYRIV